MIFRLWCKYRLKYDKLVVYLYTLKVIKIKWIHIPKTKHARSGWMNEW